MVGKVDRRLSQDRIYRQDTSFITLSMNDVSALLC